MQCLRLNGEEVRVNAPLTSTDRYTRANWKRVELEGLVVSGVNNVWCIHWEHFHSSVHSQTGVVDWRTRRNLRVRLKLH